MDEFPGILHLHWVEFFQRFLCVEKWDKYTSSLHCGYFDSTKPASERGAIGVTIGILLTFTHSPPVGIFDWLGLGRSRCSNIDLLISINIVPLPLK